MTANLDGATVCAAIMAGGAGTRLWPESRKDRPKPFLPLLPDGRSTLEAAFSRLDGLIPLENRLVVAGRAFQELVFNALPELAPNRLLLEPCGRDVAPCVAWAALEALRIDPDATLVVLPSDHSIRPDSLFRDAISRAVRLVETVPTRFVVLGIPPTEPSSAYGYVEIGAPLDVDEASGIPAFQAASFREKPNVETARILVESGRYLWNAGVFIWKAREILAAIRRFEPELGATFEKIAEIALQAPDEPLADDPRFVREFSNAKRISIDYAVLERAENVVVLKAPFAWDDLGSFAALERLATPRRSPAGGENGVVGAELVAENAKNNFVRVLARPGAFSTVGTDSAPRRKLVALVDVDDLLVVETPDALLVAKKGNDAALRRVVERLRTENYDAYL